jgi:desulfoferrodoxin (superoxide reductase-like protein)
MTQEHYIMHVDAYIDKKFISRVIFTPDKINAAVGLHLKVTSGSFQAIEKCNLHGAWLSEIKI